MSLPTDRPKMHAGNAREASTLTVAGGDLSAAGEFYLDAVKVEFLALRAHAGGVTPDSRTPDPCRVATFLSIMRCVKAIRASERGG